MDKITLNLLKIVLVLVAFELAWIVYKPIFIFASGLWYDFFVDLALNWELAD